MKRLILLAFVAAALPARSEDSGPRHIAVTLPAGDVHEECMTLKAGEKRSYEWKSDVPVDFNIHYHHEPRVFYPVKKDRVKSAQGTFAPKSEEGYCWMWTSGKAPAKLEGRISPP
ncbi:MAG TPA: hypothetical protein VKR38_06275 [Usitatibacter sp.]|nr:hypothetical protein [Usitatibacter sp.]